MKNVLVTGARGFIGRNLAAHLATIEGIHSFLYDVNNSPLELEEWLERADVVFHLAGVNRPHDIHEYERGNSEFTGAICRILRDKGAKPKIVMSSSIQATIDNPYGISKKHAEESLKNFALDTGAAVSIYRLKNVFGKWCRPEYNSVTATFCHNIAHNLPIKISDPNKEIELVYIDDVIKQFMGELSSPLGPPDYFAPTALPYKRISLADLAGRIQSYHDMQTNLVIPDFSDRFNQCLYATYLSYVEADSMQYDLVIKSDARGSLAEFIKSYHFGQIFVSRTLPGITRGNHYHHTKSEKFFVISGEALIRMRHIECRTITEHRVRGEDFHVLDIPPGYTHSITNVGKNEMITLFWSSEVFDPDQPDTYFMEVS